MRKVIVFMLMAALALAAAGDALAAKKKKPAAKPSTVTGAPAMSVVIVRSTEAGCEPLCPQWIEAEGEITAGTPARFEKAFKAMGKAKLPVVISSPGGNIDAALQIGRMIRKRSLDVYVGATAYAGCKPSDAQCKLPAEFQGIYRGQMLEYSAYCFSACPIVLAGGVKRFVGGFSPVGVHQAKQVWTQQQIFYREKYIIVKGKKKVISRTEVSRKMLKPQVSFGLGHGLRGKLAAYYKEMGVDTAILDEFNKAAFKDINILTPAQLDHFNLRTALVGPSYFLRNAVCKSPPPAANCVKREGNAAGTGKATVAGDAMTLHLVQASKQDCKKNCGPWIAANGVITPESVRQLDSMLKTLGYVPGLKIMISSPGGDSAAAMDMGRLIHKNLLDVETMAFEPESCSFKKNNCKPLDKLGTVSARTRLAICDDACIFVLAGGVARSASTVTLHDPALYVAPKPGQTPQETVSAYLKEMLMPKDAISRVADVPQGAFVAIDSEALMRAGLTSR